MASGGDGGESNHDGEGGTKTSESTGDGDELDPEPCPTGTWDHDSDPDTDCEAWTQCDPGERVDEAGTPSSDRTCASCEDGTYSDQENSASCIAWTECPSGVAQAATATEDQTCESPAIDVAVGSDFSCVLREDGSVGCWGNNSRGQLGNGGTERGRFPAPVMIQGENGLETLTDVVQLSAGTSFACALRDDTSVWCWGDDSSGQLGTGTYEDDDFVPHAVEVEGVPAVSHLDAGGSYACAVLSDQTARCWGGNGTSWALGGGGEDRGRIVTVASPSGEDALTGLTRIAAGGPHTCAATEEGVAYCWGAAQYGEVYAPFGGSAVPVAPQSDLEFVDVAAGVRTSCFQSNDGHVSCLGIGPFGTDSTENRELVQMPLPQDEDGNWSPRVLDVEVDESARCMLFEDGSMRCWGANGYGQLGDGSTDHSIGLVEVMGLNDIVAMDAGYGRACAVQEGGKVYCWGSNANGEVGDASLFGSTVPVRVPDVSDAIDVVSGSNHSCALHDSGKVTCWGKDDQGQLGFDSDEAMSGPVELSAISEVAQLSAKANLTLAVKEDQTVRAWGTGLSGALEAVEVQNVSGLQEVVSVSLGMNHVCAIHENGTLSCWGDNECSQAGPDVNEVDQVNSPEELTEFSSADGFAGGQCHSCVLFNDEVWCWGGHGLGEAGSAGGLSPAELAEKVTEGVTQIVSGLGHNLALTEDGQVLAWGHNELGQLGYAVVGFPNSSAAQPVHDLGAALAIAAGETHSCAVLETGEAACWGENSTGQLGRGVVSDYEVDAEVVDGLSDVVKMSAGAAHTCALHQDGAISCWGTNDAFQLGQTRDLYVTRPHEVTWAGPKDQ